MKVTWNFIAALAAGFLLALGLAGLAFYLNLGVHSNQSKWAFEVNQRKQLLAKQIASRKLIVAGGSATLFGISARELEALTGYRTVNLGTHAALGMDYILREARQAARPGDAVLLVPEYELYQYGKLDPSWADALLIDYIVARDPGYLHSLSPAERWCVFMLTSDRRLIRGLKNRSRPEGNVDVDVYRSSYINQWGDQEHATEATRPARRESAFKVVSSLAQEMPANPRGFAHIAAFCAWAHTNGVRVLATFPNLYDRPEYHQPPAQKGVRIIMVGYARLGVPVVGKYTDALLPPEQFYDTIYHLTTESARARTQRLARQLLPYLSEGKRQPSG